MKKILFVSVAFITVCAVGAWAFTNTKLVSAEKPIQQFVVDFDLNILPKGQVEVIWPAVAGYDKYAIYRGVTGTDLFHVKTVSATRYIDEAVMPDTKYSYRVMALRGVVEAPKTVSQK